MVRCSTVISHGHFYGEDALLLNNVPVFVKRPESDPLLLFRHSNIIISSKYLSQLSFLNSLSTFLCHMEALIRENKMFIFVMEVYTVKLSDNQ